VKDGAAHTAPVAKQPVKNFFSAPGKENFFGGSESADKEDNFFKNTGVQAKLMIGPSNDSFEKQADTTADKVVSKLNNPAPAIQTKAVKEEEQLQKKEEEIDKTGNKLQKKSAFESNEDPAEKQKIQTKSENSSGQPASSVLQSQLNSTKGGGQPLPDQAKQSMESGFGADFSGVRIHNDSNAAKMNSQIGAQAFTHGNDIYFNEGKYNPNSSEGSHLLAHELTHTVQQGASVQKKDKQDATPAIQTKLIQKADAPAAAPAAGSTETVDISKGTFTPSEKLKTEIEESKYKGVDVILSMGEMGGTATVKITGKNDKYDIKGAAKAKIPLNVPYLSAASPTLHTGITDSVVKGKVGTPKSSGDLDNWIQKNAASLGWTGIDIKSLQGKFTNDFTDGTLKLSINDVSVKVAEFATATLTAGFENLQKPVVKVSATVKAKGIADATLNITNEKGPLTGGVDVGVNFASFSGTVSVVYKDDGSIDIKGTVSYSANKLSGSLTLIATDKATADNFAREQVGAGGNAAEASLPAEVPAPAGKGERALAGMGSLTFNLTEWFAGTVSVIVDGKGDVTVVGKIAPPKEIELFPQKNFDKELFKLEARAAYGIPVVGNVFVFANVALIAMARVGPAKIYNIEIEGTYSTDPAIAKSITIAGSLNISAYAGLRLRAEGGVGLTILGHDIKLGVGVNADAGVKGYVDARPVIGYRDPGEFFFKGHMEIAAQPFLGLSGDLFAELDSPWWSPAPDKKWTWPIGSLEYPLPGEFGIGADMEYVLGSGKTPEISFGKADFDGGKFMTDLVDEKVPSGGGKGKQEKPGKFVDGGAGGASAKPADTKGGDKGADKKAPPAKGGGGKDKKGKDADKNDELKNMDAAMKKVDALAKGKAMTKAEITAAVEKIKAQHKVAITVTPKGDAWEISVAAKGKGSKKPARVKANRQPGDEKDEKGKDSKEKQKKTDAAVESLKAEDKKIAKDGKINKEEAEKVAASVKNKNNDVIKGITVIPKDKKMGYHVIQKWEKTIYGSDIESDMLADGLSIGNTIHYKGEKDDDGDDLIYTIHSVNISTHSVFLVAPDGSSKKPIPLETFNKAFNKTFIKVAKDESVPKMEGISPVTFQRSEHHDADEYARQLEMQERGINAMAMNAWLKHRKDFDTRNDAKGSGRHEKSGKAQEDHRADMRKLYYEKKFKELYEKYLQDYKKKMKESDAEIKAVKEAKKQAEKDADNYMKGTAALHGPDQVAGGHFAGLHGLGSLSINSSIGSQWKDRYSGMESEVKKFKTKIQKEHKDTSKIKMNIKLNLNKTPRKDK